MTSSRGRPSDRAEVARATSTRELESSNSTTAAFLGGKQKDWMSGGRLPVTSQQIPSATLPDHQHLAQQSNVFGDYNQAEAPLPSEPDRGRFPAQRRRRGGTKTYPCRKNAPVTSSKAPSVPPSPMGETCPPISTVKEGSRNVGNVLPSPSPSIETRRQSTNIVDLEDEPQTSGNELRTRLEELVAQHGGIEAIEKKLQDVECPSSHPAQAVTSPTLVASIEDQQSIRSSAGAERPELYANQTFHSHSLPANCRAASAANNSVSENVSEPRSQVQNPPDLFPGASGPSFSPTVEPDNDDFPKALASFEAEMRHFCQKVAHRLHYSSVDSRSGKDLEHPRLNLLRDACERSDLFYLCLHQLYIRDHVGKRLGKPTLNAAYQGGLDKLSFLLLPNEGLSIDAIKWFSEFPLPFETLFSGRPPFQSAHRKVLKCLIQLGTNFDIMRSQCMIRRYPPLVDELFRLLNVESFTLQQVIFRAILREIWRSPQDQCFQHADEMFSKSYKDVMHRKSINPSAGADEAHSRQFVFEYSQVSLLHEQHIQQQSMTSMPPPQQGQSGPGPRGSVDYTHGQRILRPTSTSSVTASHATASSRPIFPSVQSHPPSQGSANTALPMSQDMGSSQPSQSPIALAGHYNQVAYANSGPQAHNPPQTRNGSLPANPRSTQSFPMLIQTQQILPSNASNRGLTRSQQNNGSQFQQQVQTQSPITPNRPNLPSQWTPPSELQGNRNEIVRQHQESIPSNIPFIRANPHLTQSQANPTLNALHQAHVRSPILSPPAIQGNKDNRVKLFRHIKHVNMSPRELSNVRRHINWAFEIDKAVADNLVKDIPGCYGAPPTRVIRSGSTLCRVRCINIKNTVGSLSESEWVVADNVWPGSTAIILNGNALEIRKKSHHGKDLPIDATPYIKHGINNISTSIIGLPEGSTARYEIGIEIIEVVDEQSIKSNIPIIHWQEARQRILNRFGNSDPDVQVVNSQMILDLTDPFMASIFEVPVRGSSCLHSQCFDRDLFLQTRNSMKSNEPCGPDEFRCPICSSDARPQSLVIDGFFVRIREELQKMERLDAKAVILHPSGFWEIKEEEEGMGEEGDGSGRRYVQATRRSAGRRGTPRDVIELDD